MGGSDFFKSVNWDWRGARVAFLGVVGVDAHAGRSWLKEARGMAWWGLTINRRVGVVRFLADGVDECKACTRYPAQLSGFS